MLRLVFTFLVLYTSWHYFIQVICKYVAVATLFYCMHNGHDGYNIGVQHDSHYSTHEQLVTTCM